MKNFEQTVEKYAELIVKVGVNIQKGQTLVINAPIEAQSFVHKTALKAYEAGAKHVQVEWKDEELSLIKYNNAPDEAFHEFPNWIAKGYEEMAEEGAAFISIYAENPDLLKDVDPERIAASNKAAGKALQTYRQYIQSDKVSWAVVSVPTVAWAQKVFPELSSEQSVEKLWEAIFNATRLYEEEPIEAWKKHNQTLQDKVDFLNEKKYKKLHYRGHGTELTIELPKKHLWEGGGSFNKDNVEFVANMPTEEVFTTPLKTGVNGIVTSTKPLHYGGNVIENFTLTFEEGRIVNYTAEKGLNTLKRLIEIDEGSHYLGEVALVPHDSPISNSNIVFFNTLYDENASCHLAIGSAYTSCLEGGKEMSEEELAENGSNSSITHVDFMMGSAELDIDAETHDGSIEPLFRNGNWA
ncbi:aminopeptidase [Bacillus solimangrovi]|uniref:Peptidase M29 n=1 Tax=Bacillus solimangrovi TaxID=1305675 RepID=A0A1E5LF49_9BACI|nr:aminopeptidase [Bacillus solimangrovi]OEH92693.1 peptidase M29 [Bacillus solimangrovi]